MRRQKTTKLASAARRLKKKPRRGKRLSDIGKRKQIVEFPALYRAEALVALRGGFRLAYKQRGRSSRQADTVFARLTANLRVLRQLHALSRGVLSGDEGAAAMLRARLDDLAQRYPAFAGSAERLLKRAGRPSSRDRGGLALRLEMIRGQRGGGAADPAGQPCSMISFGGMVAVYAGAVSAYGRGGVGRPQALDVIAGLSLGHGRLEAFAHAFGRDGVGGVGAGINWGEASGDPTYGLSGLDDGSGVDGGPGLDGGLGGHGRPGLGDGAPGLGDGTPGLGGGTPGLGDPETDLTGHGGGSFPPFTPSDDFPPATDPCELVREACEALLIDTIANEAPGTPQSALPAAPVAWADNIDSIEFPHGRCAGETMVIKGHDFGPFLTIAIGTGEMHSRALVMMVQGRCARVDVERGNWYDDRIEVALPDGITGGPVGIFDPSQVVLYNHSTSAANRAANDIVAASKCLGAPIDWPFAGTAFPILASLTTVPCAPPTDRNVIKAGAPIIRGFTAIGESEYGQTILVEPGETISLSWSVINADTITLQRISLEGPLFGSQTYVSNPGGTSWSFGQTWHDHAAAFVYQLLAENGNGCGSAEARVVILASKRPGLGITGIEVTHGIQTLDNTVPLVDGKRTAVRVYGTHNRGSFGLPDHVDADVVPYVGGRLRVRHQSEQSWSAWIDPIGSTGTAPATIDLHKPIDRQDTTQTLNFMIPTDYCNGTLSIEAEISVENFGAPLGYTRGFSERVSRQFDGFVFHQRRSLSIKFIPVTVAPDLAGVVTTPEGFDNPPTDEQCTDFLRETLKYLPTSYVSISRHDWLPSVTIRADSVTIPMPLGPPLVEQVGYDISGNVILRALDLLHQQTDDPSFWVVLVPAASTAGPSVGWGVWGQAADIPGFTYMTPVGGSQDDAVGQNDQAGGAHELAHCLNQEHISLQCGGAMDMPASGGQTPEEWGENGGILVDVPFDVEWGHTIAWRTVSELMTYCPPKWTSPKRWRLIFDFIGPLPDEDDG